MNELVEGVLSVGAGLAPYNGPGVVGHAVATARHVSRGESMCDGSAKY